MLTETGQVVAVEKDGLWVETVKQSACAQCSANKGCGTKVLADRLPGASMTFVKAIFNDSSRSLSWHPGDRAMLGIEENALVKSALLAYLVPLITMIIFAGVGDSLFVNEMYVGLSALVGLFFGGVAIKIHSTVKKDEACYQPVVLSKVLSSSI